MTVIRSYSSSEDAHLARMHLGNEGIEAHVIDEATASVTPHIAFASGVRLMVADEDVARARDILGLPALMEARRPNGGIPWWVFAIAGVAMFTLLAQALRQRSANRTPAQSSDYDRNGDGRADERFDFRGDVVVKTWRDNDFDGIWDERIAYENSQPVLGEADLDFDGKFDSSTEYRFGIPAVTTVRDGGQGPVLTRIEFERGVLNRVWEDSDGDGDWDLLIRYDAFGRETIRQEPD